MQYVIYLKTNEIGDVSSSYGYWTGKKYIVQGEEYPVCESIITENTKRYKSYKIAENSAKKTLERFSYVRDFEVEEVD